MGDQQPETTQAEQAEAELAHATSIEGANDELLKMAAALTESAMMVHNIPVDFAGLSMNILRCPDTHRLEAIFVTPVDLIGDKPFPRYDPVKKVREVGKPKIVLAS